MSSITRNIFGTGGRDRSDVRITFLFMIIVAICLLSLWNVIIPEIDKKSVFFLPIGMIH